MKCRLASQRGARCGSFMLPSIGQQILLPRFRLLSPALIPSSCKFTSKDIAKVSIRKLLQGRISDMIGVKLIVGQEW